MSTPSLMTICAEGSRSYRCTRSVVGRFIVDLVALICHHARSDLYTFLWRAGQYVGFALQSLKNHHARFSDCSSVLIVCQYIKHAQIRIGWKPVSSLSASRRREMTHIFFTQYVGRILLDRAHVQRISDKSWWTLSELFNVRLTLGTCAVQYIHIWH